MADLRHLGFRGPIMGSLKNSCTTSYRSSIDTIALNCLVFEKIAFLHFGDRQTERQTDGQPQRKAALAVASGGLIIKLGVDNRGGDGTGCFEIKVRTDTTKFTNMRIAGFRQSRNFI